jgi:hypothetical protein
VVVVFLGVWFESRGAEVGAGAGARFVVGEERGGGGGGVGDLQGRKI